MLCERAAIVDDGDGPTTGDDPTSLDWRIVDRALRGIARRRATLDAEEARWLREAERLQIWRPLGMVSALDYLERVLGHTPHVAKERLRVARTLGDLPMLTDAFARGELPFSAIRELTRVATPATEIRWRDAALGKTVREVEGLVAGHRPGDDPEAPADPQVRTHVVRFELAAEVFARLRQVRAALTDERGTYVDDDQLVTALCDAVLDRAGAGNEPTGRAKFQIAVVVCERCDRGWQDGAGTKVPIDAAAVERARCDAQHIGSLDGDTPERAYQDIPPSVVRFVWRRDGGRCQTPGCRSSSGLEIHHVIRQADGGGHEPSNLRIQCSACHIALHRGTLAIIPTESGRLEARRRAEPRTDVDADNAAAKLDATIVRTQARDALVGLGWKSAIARTAVDEAWSHVGPAVAVEMLIREALRRCPKPTG